mmetsp:Transcript_48999/g.88100  ORF Transcript_48999/g.88100 Transcript_48999/m.88100 type:complete len:322 (-) Transcript_48999:28-993(-)
MAGIALHHHRGRLEDRHGDLGYGQLLMVGLLGRDDRGVGCQHEMDARVGHEVRLELSDVNVQRTIKAQGSRQRTDDLGNQSVEVRVCRPLNVKVPAANVIKSLIVIHDGNISMFEEGVHAQHSVIRLDNSCGDLRTAPNGEGDLALLAVVNRQALKHQASQARSSATAACVVHAETLKTGTVVRKLPNAVKHEVNDFLADGVVASCKVVRSIFLATDQLFRMEELTVSSCSHLIHDSRFEIDHHTTRDVLAGTRLAEKCVKCIIATSNGLVTWHLTIRLDAMFQAEELPAGIADLNATLSDVNADGLTHGCWKVSEAHLVM